MKDADQLDLIIEDAPQGGGVSIAVVVSAIVHALIVLYLIKTYRPLSKDTPAPPIARYVELIRQDPKQFTEAPGPKASSAPLNAPFSDANREASAPRPTGDQPTTRPGSGGLYVPRGVASPTPTAAADQPTAEAAAATQPQPPQPSDTFVYRPTQANAAIDWRGAIREVGKVASLGDSGQQGVDLGNAGGEKGYAKDGPLSFETQWYDWGEYAQSMVSRIRVNWYNNMPQIIQTGLKGVVVIRFTIHRDGSITDVTMLSSSTVPPYDFAAKKAIELSSPLNPLPKDFPKATERVTAAFFYNQEPPK